MKGERSRLSPLSLTLMSLLRCFCSLLRYFGPVLFFNVRTNMFFCSNTIRAHYFPCTVLSLIERLYLLLCYLYQKVFTFLRRYFCQKVSPFPCIYQSVSTLCYAISERTDLIFDELYLIKYICFQVILSGKIQCIFAFLSM